MQVSLEPIPMESKYSPNFAITLYRYTQQGPSELVLSDSVDLPLCLEVQFAARLWLGVASLEGYRNALVDLFGLPGPGRVSGRACGVLDVVGDFALIAGNVLQVRPWYP